MLAVGGFGSLLLGCLARRAILKTWPIVSQDSVPRSQANASDTDTDKGTHHKINKVGTNGEKDIVIITAQSLRLGDIVQLVESEICGVRLWF